MLMKHNLHTPSPIFSVALSHQPIKYSSKAVTHTHSPYEYFNVCNFLLVRSWRQNNGCATCSFIAPPDESIVQQSSDTLHNYSSLMMFIIWRPVAHLFTCTSVNSKCLAWYIPAYNFQCIDIPIRSDYVNTISSDTAGDSWTYSSQIQSFLMLCWRVSNDTIPSWRIPLMCTKYRLLKWLVYKTPLADIRIR